MFIVHVSVVVEQEERIALVKEKKPASFGKWNLPGGHLEHGEALLEGAAREVREETGLELPIAGFLGVYTGLGEHHFLNFVFTARASEARLRAAESEILECRWFEIAEIQAMHPDAILNPHKMRRILNDYAMRGPVTLDCIGEGLYGAGKP